MGKGGWWDLLKYRYEEFVPEFCGLTKHPCPCSPLATPASSPLRYDSFSIVEHKPAQKSLMLRSMPFLRLLARLEL